MATQGLNFQTHQFNDPTEGLQKALGAGSMFAQSLKSMQDFESEQAKLRMMQQEKDRQAKIDFEASQEKAKNIAASEALNDKSVKMDFGNEMYRGVTDQEKNAMVAKSDTELGIKSLSYADMYKGVDASKLDKDQLAERDQLLAADSDKTAKYTAGNKLAVQKRLNMLNGMGNDEAEKAAAAALGLKDDQAKSILAGDTLQQEFGNRVLDTANSPLYMQSDAQALRDFKKKYGTTAQIEASIGSADKAESMARAKLKEDIDALEAKKGALGTQLERDQVNSQIQMLQLQMQSIGSPLERASYKESSGSDSKGQTADQEYAKKLEAYLNSYKYAPSEVRDEIIKLAKGMQIRGNSPEQIGAAISASAPITKGDKDNPDSYTFSRNALADIDPDKDYLTRKHGSGSSETSYYAQAMQEKQGVIDKINALQGKKGGSGSTEMASLEKRLAELNRTPMQSAKDAAYQAGLDFAKDFNIGKYGDKQAAAAALQQTLAGNGSGNGTGATGTKTGDPSVTSKVAPTVGVFAKTEAIYKQRENADKYGLHMDKFEKDGADRPAVGYGFSIKDVNERIASHNSKLKAGEPRIQPINPALAGKGGSIKDPGQRKIIDGITSEFIERNNRVAVKNLDGLDSANPGYENLVAATSSAYHQYGSGSKIIKPLIENAKTLMAQGKHQEAINLVHASPYGISHPGRAVDLMSAIESYSGQDLNVPKDFKFASKDAAKKYYQQLSGYLKKQGANDIDTYKTMNALKKSISGQYGEDTIGTIGGSSTAAIQAKLAANPPAQQAYRPLHVVPNDQAPGVTMFRNIGPRIDNAIISYQNSQAQGAYNNSVATAKNAQAHLARLEQEKASQLQSVLTKTAYDAAYKQATPAEKLRIQAEALRKYNEMDNAAAIQNLVNNRY